MVPGTAPKADERRNDVCIVTETRLTDILAHTSLLVVEVVRLA